jgi:hypothetical protein
VHKTGQQPSAELVRCDGESLNKDLAHIKMTASSDLELQAADMSPQQSQKAEVNSQAQAEAGSGSEKPNGKPASTLICVVSRAVVARSCRGPVHRVMIACSVTVQKPVRRAANISL